jgi:FkbM family methyltransferase
MFAIREILPEPVPRIRIVDAGAAEHEADPYAQLSEQGLCDVIGFEPHKANWVRRQATARPNHRYLPYALGDGRVRRFYECEGGLASSLYKPNAALLENFAQLELSVVAEYDIQTFRLDDLGEIDDIDYLKLDVQGAEFDIIGGAQARLAGTLVVHTEVEFIPVYVDQPLFGDVDVALRQSGFWLHTLGGLTGGLLRPFEPSNRRVPAANQILWAEAAVYVRNFMSFDRLSPEKLMKLAIILHEVYQSWGLAALALRAHHTQTGQGLGQAYLDRLRDAGIA